jgi:hypothetical protein
METEIYELLQSNQESTFPINKIDCNLSVFDEITSSDEQLGFSIKSFLAGSPTLINARKATNFIYNTSVKTDNYNSLKAKFMAKLPVCY